MPRLVFLGRKLKVSNDDLLAPSVPSILSRITFAVALLVFEKIVGTCALSGGKEGLISGAMYAMVTIFIVRCVIDFLIILVSMRGSIINTKSRAMINKLLVGVLVCCALEVVVALLASASLFVAQYDCTSSIVIRICTVGVLWFFIFGQLLLFYCFYDSVGNSPETELHESMASAKLEKRVKQIFLGINADTQVYKDIAFILSSLFKGVDLTITDIAAGCVLVRNKQKREAMKVENEVRQISTQAVPQVFHKVFPNWTIGPSINFRNDEEWETVSTIADFSKYFMAVYGWPLYLAIKPCSGFCDIWSTVGCCCCGCLCKRRTDYKKLAFKDNACLCNAGAAVRMGEFLDTSVSEIVYMSFSNTIYCPVYCIFVDHGRKSIIVAIRGTMSLHDALTDLTAHAITVDIEGMGKVRCHNGIYKSAQQVFADIIKNGHLQTTRNRLPHYKVTVLGHSLGAGCAALLSVLMWKDYRSADKLCCYAYSPPAGLVDKETAEKCKEFIVSIIVGKDMIPRLSLRSVGKLRKEILNAIIQCNENKWALFGGVCCSTYSESSAPASSDHEESAKGLLQDFDRVLMNNKQLIDNADECDSIHRRLDIDNVEESHPPGRILYCRVISSTKKQSLSGFQQRVYRMEWQEPTSTEWGEIIVSPSMVRDHLPWVVRRVFTGCTDLLASRAGRKRAIATLPDEYIIAFEEEP